jgi:PHD/YefM family antitoxin component YafN of YafNO toxin-antitoxin module
MGMAKSFTRSADQLHRLTQLPTVSATKLAEGMQAVTHTVMSRGAVLVTRHDRPAMVLVSVDRFLELEAAAEPDLDALTQQFDEMFSRMQRPEAARRMDEAFRMTSAELGEAAVRAAK